MSGSGRRSPGCACFRGIDTLTALALHLELGGDWQRFGSPRPLFAWLGLTPSLEQSGESARQGAITKTGSVYARRLLVESAWHYAREPRIGVTLTSRQHGQPDHVLQIAWRAQHRLHRLHHRLRERGKPAQRRHRRGRPRALRLPLGRGHRAMT